MSQFCTSCGAVDSGSAFCTNCGAAQPARSMNQVADTAPSSVFSQPKLSEVASSVPAVATETTATRKKFLLSALALIVFAGGSVGGFFLGKGSIDLKKERTIAFDSGFEDGRAEGFSDGKDVGYDEGYADGERQGCRDAFSFSDGFWDHIVPYDTVYQRMTGDYYKSKTSCG